MTPPAQTVWDRAERTLVGLLGALAMIVGMVQVIGRYFFPADAISWAEEVIVYLVVWAVMIVSSQLVRTDGHVRPISCCSWCRRADNAGWRRSIAS